MRLICLVSGGCRWYPIREEWLPADDSHQTVRLLRFEECAICRDTRATITSPEIEEVRLAKPQTRYPKED